MEEERALQVIEAEYVQLGSVRATSPSDVVVQASSIAGALKAIIAKQKLFTMIRGRKFVRVEGWTTLGAMLGVLPREVSAIRLDDGSYEAMVELVRASDGAVIGRGSAICGMDEEWATRKEYARRSMAITRATGKAYRLAFSWIMTLAGYEPTPAEEMDEVAAQAKRDFPPHGSSPAKSAQSRPRQTKKQEESTPVKQARVRWGQLWNEGKKLGLEIESLKGNPTADEIDARCDELGTRIVAAKKDDTAAYPAECIAAVLEAGLSENVYSIKATLVHAEVIPDDPPDMWVSWFSKYRESRDAGGSTEEAAGIANAWLASELSQP